MTETAEIEFIRDYPVALTRLWRAVTEPVQVIQWFGPEGTYLESCQADFTKPGPWFCAMRGKESGNLFKVSGQITHVHPPKDGTGSVAFTWAWHDETDARGVESHVTFTVQETKIGARFVLSHQELPGAEAAKAHTAGWLSTLRKLDFFLDPDASLSQ